MHKYVLLPALLCLGFGRPETFAPVHRLTAIGTARGDMTDELLAKRTELMFDAQTFAILRDPKAVAGAARITSLPMQKIFATAAAQSGLPASLISAVSFLESWGETAAQSPAGPKGVMQIAAGTAPLMGLQIVYATRYRVTTETIKVKTKRGKTVSRVVKRRIPYQVLLRDERMIPERAIPAAANYIARLQNRFGGLDWAIFAYHCGEGCVGSMRSMTEHAKGIAAPYTVSKMFFSATPALNRELYIALQREMERDWSPTYWFRIMRAEQLLKLYKEDPEEFKRLAAEYRYEPNPLQRAPHRLAAWLRSADLRYQSIDDIKADGGKNLVRLFDDPVFFGFHVQSAEEDYQQASAPAIGTLVYIAYEARRLFEEMHPRDKWAPLEVTSLVRPLGLIDRTKPEGLAHGSGHVFDIEYRSLPLAEREALEFVLEDMGYEGYLGFVEEAPKSGTLHIGCSPSSREFFTQVYEEAKSAARPSPPISADSR